MSRTHAMHVVAWPPSQTSPEDIPSKIGEDGYFVPQSWSPDDSMIAGHVQARGGDEPGGIYIYRFATHDYEKLTDSGCYPRWLPDSRRLIFSKVNVPSVFLVDRVTKEAHEMRLDLHGTFYPFSLTVSRDGATIYLVESDLEADLWKFDLAGASAAPRP
jgi:Tol biopolymer transport system component